MSKNSARKYVYGGKYQKVACVRRWTFAAVQCYLRNCICKDCFYNDFFKKTREDYGLGDSYDCKMKATILELVRVFGSPDLNAPYALGIKEPPERQGDVYEYDDDEMY